MKKSGTSKELKTRKAAAIVRALQPNHEQDVRGGLTVTKMTNCSSTN